MIGWREQQINGQYRAIVRLRQKDFLGRLPVFRSTTTAASSWCGIGLTGGSL